MMRRYGNYGRGYGRDEYVDQYEMDNYGRRGVPGTGRRYSGEDTMNEMYEAYQDYSEGKEETMNGNYGAQEDTLKSLDYMLKSVVKFIEMLKNDASSQEEIDLIQKYSKKISEM